VSERQRAWPERPAAEQHEGEAPSLALTVLGCSGSFAGAGEACSGYLVRSPGATTVVDLGSGTLANLQAHAEVAEVDAVVLTHSDGDHTGLASRFRDAGARVLIHTEDAATLAKPAAKSGDAAPAKLARYLWRPALWRFMGHMAQRGGAHPPAIEPDDTFADGDVLDVPGRPQVLHTPGHTAGHCALLLGDRAVLFVGDAICTWNPLTGSRSPQLMPYHFNEDNRACLRSLDVIARTDADVLLPGHGEPWHGRPATAAERARATAG
jgi:glyoxylase-like metal-dependent hydrolase (beta-lactamase superfamily II)